MSVVVTPATENKVVLNEVTKTVEVLQGRNEVVVATSSGASPAQAASVGVHFVGIFDELQDLKDALPKPNGNYQAIVIQPSEYYYHSVGGQWVQLAPVGSLHQGYVGYYDTVQDLESANPAPAEGNLAIVGTVDKSFYLYDSGAWASVKGTDIPALTKRMDVAEQHLQTLQNDAKQQDLKISNLESGQQVLTNNINQKPDGVEFTNSDGSKLSDLSKLKLENIEVKDNGDGTFTLAASPKIDIADGQTAGSKSFSGDAIVFPGATVEADPNDSDVVLVTFPVVQPGTHPIFNVDGKNYASYNSIKMEGFTATLSGGVLALISPAHSGISVGDGTNASRSVDTLIFDGHEAYGVGTEAHIHLEFAHFKTIAERDTWSTKFGASMSYDTIAVVDELLNGFVQWFRFDTAKQQWVDYAIEGIKGITLTDKENTEWSPVNNISFPQAEFNQVGQKTAITFPGSSFTLSVKDEAGTDTLGIDTLVFESSLVEPDSLDSKEIRIKPYMEFTSTSVSEEPQTTSVKANTVSVSYPLEVFASPNAELDAVVALAHGSLEMGHAPAYLAYAHSEIAIVGKEGLSGHHDGAVWFTDSVYPSNAFMSVDKPAKTISIQEADTLDPNVTGGTDYLIAFRIHMQGNAPDDGKVRIYLWDTIKNNYIVDVNGNPMGSQRLYKRGEELGYISVIGVVNAKGSTTFTTHVMDDFVDDELIISSRTEGASGILVQALTSDEKTSPALLQFEQDTNQQIDFDSKYYGPNLISLDWMLQEDSPEFTAPAGSIKGLNDGALLYAIGQTKISVADKTMSLVTADFNLGKFINPDDTHLLKGKTIKAYTTMANPDGDIVMAMFKWVGEPGKATTKIYGARNQGGGIVPLAGWEQVEEDVIVANALGDFKEYSHNFTVPDDAKELAIILYPSLGLTTDVIRIKGFNADIINPFMGYIVKAPELYTEQHLKSSPQYAKLAQDRQGYASLRYTLNNVPASGVPMPVGMIKAGKANITIDDTVNVVVGSAARGGEGAIKFGDEGRIVVKSELYIYPGESLPKGNKATARFWYASVSDDGQTFTKIDDSETSFLVTGGDLPSKCKMNPFGMDVKAGNRIALLSLTDATDDAYISSNFTSTMLTTEIDFEEILVQGYDDPDLISAPLDKSLIRDCRRHPFTGNTSQNIAISGLSIPSDVELAVVTVKKDTATGFNSVEAEHAYNESTQTLTVHVGGAASGTVFLEFWSK